MPQFNDKKEIVKAKKEYFEKLNQNKQLNTSRQNPVLYATTTKPVVHQTNNQAIAFFERLESARYRPMSERLTALIDRAEYLKIFDYISKPKGLVQPLVQKLKPNECLRVPKEDSHLSRTFNIICSHTGELMLMLETKSKLANNSKEKKSESGTFKEGKPAWRIDDGEAEYFNLVSYGVDRVKNLKNESLLSQQLEPFGNEMTVYQLGATFDKEAKTKMSIYAPKAVASLNRFLSVSSRIKSPYKDDILNLLKDEAVKRNILFQILTAIHKMHQNGYVHQDIKTDNFLIYYDPYIKGVSVKISDYGLTIKEPDISKASSRNVQSSSIALATVGYESPEMSSYYSIKSRGRFDYYHGTHRSYARDIVENQKIPAPLTDAFPPHKANDMWALGIVAFELMQGRSPKFNDQDRAIIRNDPILSGLLTVDRGRRFTIDQALSTLNKRPTPKISQ